MSDKDTHAISATAPQIDYLNKLADVSHRLRAALKHMKRDIDINLDGPLYNASLSHQTLYEVQYYSGALNAMRDMQWTVFNDLPDTGLERRARVDELKVWIDLAVTANPDGLMGHNWFSKA